MKITVVTPCFNSIDTIESTLESVACQTYPYIEHLVMDGGSHDGTMDLLKSWNKHTILLESAKDKGIYDALNKGINKATGDIVGFMHSDDVFQDCEVLDKIARAFQDPSVDAVYGDLVYVSHHNLNRVVRFWRAGNFENRKLRLGWMPPHPTFYVRRSLYQTFGAFDLRYRISADYDCMLRILSSPKIKYIYIPEVLVRMRLGGVSNRSFSNILLKTSEDVEITRQNLGRGYFTVIMKNLTKIRQFCKFR